MIIHNDTKLMQCDKCGKLVTVLWALTHGWKKDSGDKKHICPDCKE